MVLIHTGLRIKEQHEIILDFFRIEHDEIYLPFIIGTENQFRTRMFMFLSFLMVFKLLFDIYLPTIFEVVFALAFNYLMVTGIIKTVRAYNNSSATNYGMFTMLFYLAMMVLSIVAVGFTYAG